MRRKKMKRCKKVLISALAVIVAASFMCIPVPSFAAGAPAMYPDTFWVNNPYNYTGIENFDEENGDVINSVTSSNPSVLSAKKDSSGDFFGWKLISKKPGTAKLTVKLTVSGKAYTISQSYKVKKYPKAIKKLKLNGKTVKVTAKKKAWELNKKKYKKSYVKVKVTPKKGWKVMYATVSMGDYKDLYSYKDLKKSVIKKGKKIKFPKKYKWATLTLMIYNEKQDAYFLYYVNLYR